jgi:hypothetical protein
MADDRDDRQDPERPTSAPVPPGQGNPAASPAAAPIAPEDRSPAEQAQINQDEAIASGEENVV